MMLGQLCKGADSEKAVLYTGGAGILRREKRMKSGMWYGEPSSGADKKL